MTLKQIISDISTKTSRAMSTSAWPWKMESLPWMGHNDMQSFWNCVLTKTGQCQSHLDTTSESIDVVKKYAMNLVCQPLQKHGRKFSH